MVQMNEPPKVFAIHTLVILVIHKIMATNPDFHHLVNRHAWRTQKRIREFPFADPQSN